MFGEDNNGTPMITGKLGFKHRKIAEFGFSYYGGVYNTYRIDGIEVDEKRNLSVFAFDFNTSIKKMVINGEFAYNSIDVDENAGQFFGKKQLKEADEAWSRK